MTLNEKIESAKKIIKEYTEKYPRYAISFSGGKDSVVLLDIAKKTLGTEKLPIFAVLSDTEFKETEEYISSIPNINIYRYKNSDFPEDCCRSKKVSTFKEAVKNLDCWLSGIRSDEGITRVNFKAVEERDGLIKVNPILSFTETDIWRYIAINHIKINPKYKEGYRSLSCARCSVPEQSGNEPERAGRWKGTQYEGCECGIHTNSLRN